MQQVIELRRTGGTTSHLSTKWFTGYNREVGQAGLVAGGIFPRTWAVEAKSDEARLLLPLRLIRYYHSIIPYLILHMKNWAETGYGSAEL